MNRLKEIFDQIRRLILPPSAFSWQTLILLSVFSCIMSALTNDIIRDLLASFGWIFLIFGVGWLTTEKPVVLGGLSLGPWITGALVSIFLFGNYIDEEPSLLFVSWPLISAAIAIIPHFVSSAKLKNPSPDSRQRLAILILSNVIISCWFQFYFVIQGWLQEYPGLLTNDFNRSNFVVRLSLRPPRPPRGVTILNRAETLLREELDNRRWPEVEKWLLSIKQQPEAFEQSVMRTLGDDFESRLWRLETRILPGNPDYNLQMLATWQGPSSDPEGYYLVQSCEIIQVSPPTGTSPTPSPTANPQSGVLAPQQTATSRIECGPISQPTFGEQPESRSESPSVR